MAFRINIPLQLPDARHADRYFYFRLQPGIQVPPSCTYSSSSKVFVVSDIREHFRSFHRLLIKHRIIDKYFHWIFGEGHLVVLGNSFDPKELSTEYLWFLYDLEQKARLEGGYVHFLPGPYEIMHINGKWRKEHPPYALATAKVRSPFTALYDANFELRRWLGTRNIVEKIGSLLVIHGDIFPALCAGFDAVNDINTFIRSAYRYLPEAVPDELSSLLFPDNYLLFRYPDRDNSTITKEQVEDILKKMDVDMIITTQAIQEQVTTAFEGKLISIPTNHITGNPVGLLKKKRKFLYADRQGRQEKIIV